jgi:hypothetical protein
MIGLADHAARNRAPGVIIAYLLALFIDWRLVCIQSLAH